MEANPKVSVCVLTYNPHEEKLLETLQSIVRQKNVNLQIVISDDGSKNDCFDAARGYLDSVNFFDYKFVPSNQNQGTVKNAERALLSSDGFYVKMLSPGDSLTKDTILSEWIDYLATSGKRWSFCDAIYYRRNDEGEIVICPQRAHPQIISVYKKNDVLRCRWNYAVLDDIALGAATLCERELLIQYVQRMTDKVVYAEDNSYRIMMFDGIVASYFPEDAVLYEYGTGISTGKDSVWSQRLSADWEAANKIMLAGANPKDEFQQKMVKAFHRKAHGGKITRLIRRYTEKGKFSLMCKNRLNGRMTSSELYTE